MPNIPAAEIHSRDLDLRSTVHGYECVVRLFAHKLHLL